MEAERDLGRLRLHANPFYATLPGARPAVLSQENPKDLHDHIAAVRRTLPSGTARCDVDSAQVEFACNPFFAIVRASLRFKVPADANLGEEQTTLVLHRVDGRIVAGAVHRARPPFPDQADLAPAAADFSALLLEQHVSNGVGIFLGTVAPESFRDQAFPILLSGPNGTDRLETVHGFFSMIRPVGASFRRAGLHTFRAVGPLVVPYGPHMGVVHATAEWMGAGGRVLLRECAAYVIHRLDGGVIITGLGRVYPSRGGMTLEEAWQEQGVLGGAKAKGKM